MQFRLMTMLILLTVLSIGCAILFNAPASVSIPILTCMLWISPSFWIAGIVYARRSPQAFFVGGFVAGLIPFLLASYYSMYFAGSLIRDWSVGGNSGQAMLSVLDANLSAIRVGLILLSPALFSIVGGATAILVRWITLPCMVTDKPPNLVVTPQRHPLDEVPDSDQVLRIMPPGDYQ